MRSAPKSSASRSNVWFECPTVQITDEDRTISGYPALRTWHADRRPDFEVDPPSERTNPVAVRSPSRSSPPIQSTAGPSRELSNPAVVAPYAYRDRPLSA